MRTYDGGETTRLCLSLSMFDAFLFHNASWIVGGAACLHAYGPTADAKSKFLAGRNYIPRSLRAL